MTRTALNPIFLQIGPLTIRWYGVLIAIGAIIGVWVAVKEANRRQIMSEDIIDLVLWGVPFALIGARLYYVIFQWPFYSQYPSEIIKIWHGGIAIYGGLIAAFIVTAVFTYHRHLPLWLVLDIAAPSVLIGQIVGRWGNFMNQEAYGRITSAHFLHTLHLPNFIIEQMFINGHYRQPTFLYESCWNLLGLIIILSLRHKPGLFKRGEVFLSYVLWYSFGRFFVEGMRTDSLYLGAGIRVSQLLSLLLFVAALVIFIYRRRQKNMPTYLAGSGLRYPYKREAD
ncbi:prolipoprotein diacylglyceryl transferase [Bombilactobacillus thymidiniphilus]|uniref:Phosphatidylglycerol--prolipoprotein diacylglyceryl transferase n=1 Tax=Bombilactobacillus thymidiniphilus TaxID=2923363 RepID=A0ABY4PC99_9LACO|nr:prolipoprotein diacylglyceryl transferase [Bombilactobacillus thymidiniphilus]UQS83321.1 prolipoprotein diacylglyceryl transferase [Bombilactobacillus thymidiniphilus]